MRLLLLSIALVITFSETAFTRCPRRVVRPNPMMGQVPNIYLPGYNERSMPVRMPNGRVAYEEVAVRQIPRELDVPNVRVIQAKSAYPQEIMYSKAPEVISPVAPNVPYVPNLPVPMMPMAPPPAPVVPIAPAPAPIVPVAPFPSEIIYPYPLAQEKCNCPCAGPVPPTLISPFLPSASPISALAPPTSNLLPPVIPSQSRSHFLRKVPIPPPTL